MAIASINIASMNIAETLLSKGQDSSPAIVAQAGTLTYAELRRKVIRLAAGLVEHGCIKGERIGIFAENGSFFAICYLATIRAGLVAVPLQSELSTGSVDKIVRHTGIRRLFVSERLISRVTSWAVSSGTTIFAEPALESLSSDVMKPMPDIDPPRDLAALMFTSGSTAEAKGVMVSHRNIECNTRDIVSYMELGERDRVMVVLPFSYCFGLSLLHTHLMVGGGVVINNDFKLYPESVLQDIHEKECTGFAGVPSTYQILLKRSRFLELPFPKLRWFQQAGGKLPNSCILQVVRGFPRARFFVMYGQTEATARLSYLPPGCLEEKLGSVGKGLSSSRLQVLKHDGTEVAPGSGEVGEIVATGENITLGYWEDAGETARYFKEGKLYTGDMAHADSDGFIFIVGRNREMIKSAGHRVSPKEVEEVIAEIPQVMEVAVIGVVDEIQGEAIKAFAVLAPGAKIPAEDVRRHCRERLPAFKVPEKVVILPTMPHNTSGKIDESQLRTLLQGHCYPSSRASPESNAKAPG